jgi:2-hydroxy-3-oxopropionate reductase
MDSIGFIGFGVMGTPMAENLAQAGYRVFGYDVNPVNLKTAKGVNAVSSLGEAAKAAKRFITMLPDSPQVEEVMLGAAGLLGMLSPGSIVADMSTISPKTSKKISGLAAKSGIGFIDAPVSGGRKGAAAGTLSIMVGGKSEDFQAFLPIFQAMGKTIVHVGPSGSGQTVKLCNQAMVAINIQGVCEAFSLARAEGLDLHIVRNALLGGAANSWMLENLAPQMLAGDSSAGFRVQLQIKDLRLALETAFADNVPMPATSLAASMYLEVSAHDGAANGNQSMYQAYERLGNRKFS